MATGPAAREANVRPVSVVVDPVSPDVRRLGALTEALHAVVYFAPEPAERYGALGLRGYWRGYFASRTAAVGRPNAALVTALCGGFAPAFVARAVPDIWSIAVPEDVLRARVEGATVALHRLVGYADVSTAAAATADVVARLDFAGRPMAAAHADLPRPEEPLSALWHDCTVLREHRGDGHLAVVTAAGLAWPVPHLLAADRLDPRQQDLRGWTDKQWADATVAMKAAPADLPSALEEATDRVAAPAYAGVDTARLLDLLTPLARAVADGGGVPFPNAMGLQPL